MEDPLSDQEKQQKIQQYEQFVENNLKTQLQQVLDRRDEVYTKISHL